MNFNNFNFDPAIAAGITAQGFVTPTPIQQKSIPAVLEGRDVMALAQTGTGKTAAFVLPAFERLMNGPHGTLRMLILTPTRELAEQIHNVIKSFKEYTNVSSTTVYGGVSNRGQVQKLRKGVDILIACPGRLLEHIRSGTVDLSKIELCVLDEADQMFDRGFLPDIRKILKKLPVKRQNLMFSATMPDDIRGLARDMLKDPVTVEAEHKAPLITIAHAIYPVEQDQKSDLLIDLLKHIDRNSVLVFTRTKHRTKKLAQQLEGRGFKTASLQGNLSQGRRREALDSFRSGKVQILVATDIAARGLDISSISHVINFDIPDTAEAYTHRIGRTGRATRTGDAFTFVTRDDNAMVQAIERTLGDKLKRVYLDGFTYRKNQKQTSATVEPTKLKRPATPRGNRSPQAANRSNRRQRWQTRSYAQAG